MGIFIKLISLAIQSFLIPEIIYGKCGILSTRYGTPKANDSQDIIAVSEDDAIFHPCTLSLLRHEYHNIPAYSRKGPGCRCPMDGPGVSAVMTFPVWLIPELYLQINPCLFLFFFVHRFNYNMVIQSFNILFTLHSI